MRARERRLSASPSRNRGFTLVELVVTLIVTSILAVAVLPRFADRQVFETRGFSDVALAAVQYARKVAVASRRNVCAVVSGSTLTLTMATLAGSAQACTANVVGQTAGGYAVSPRHSDVTFSGAFNVTFDGQGRPLDSSHNLLTADATITIRGDIDYTLGVTAGTGYAYIK